MVSIGISDRIFGALADNWWLLLLRGVAAIVFGVLVFAWPHLILKTLILFYGAYALVDGILAIAAAVRGGRMAPRWWLAMVGVLGVGAGLITFAWPALTAVFLLIFIAVWAISTGVMQIIGAVRLRKELANEWLLALSGALTVLFGLALLARPGVGALALLFLIGGYAITYGVLLCLFALRLRRLA